MSTINGKACVANGKNLYTDTKNFDNLASWHNSGLWTKAADTYNGLAVMQTAQDWDGLSQYIQVKTGDVLTYSVYAKYVSGTGTSQIYWMLNSQYEGHIVATSNPFNNVVTITDSWQRVSGTAVATSDGYLRPRLERGVDNTNTLQIAGIKLEKGSVATPLTPAPVDKVFSNGRQVYGRNLIPNSSTPQVIKRPEENPEYPNWVGRRIYTGLKNNETYTFSALVTAETTDKSAEKWGIRIFQITGNHVATTSDFAANTGKRQSYTFTTPDDGISYDVLIYAGGVGVSYIPSDLKIVVTVSDYKLETGIVATPWSPAPEDVL